MKRARSRDERDWKESSLNSGPRRSDARTDDRERDRYRNERDSGRHRERERDRDSHRPDYRRDHDGYRRRERSSGRDRHDRERRDGERRHDRNGYSRRSSRPRSESRTRHSERNDRKDYAGSEKEEGEVSAPSTRCPTPVPVREEQSNSLPTPPEEPSNETKKEPALEMDLELETDLKPVEETLAERRARRQAIRAKYAGISSTALSTSDSVAMTETPSPGIRSAVPLPPSTLAIANHASQYPLAGTPVNAIKLENSTSDSRMSPQAMSPSLDVFDLTKQDESTDALDALQPMDGADEQISAADYDPSFDRREDEEKRVRAVVAKDQEHEDDELTEVEEDDDVDDMFALDLGAKKKTRKVKRVRTAAPALITTTLDSAADVEGYYQVILGEQLDGGKYQVFSSLGKGMFANVVRARVLQGDASEIGKEVAIKIIRSQETMYKAGLKEAQILNKLRTADQEDKKHIVRLERTFEHRGHLCLVFESLSMNLRDVVKRFGKDIGLNIRAVRAYAHQLFLAMSLLRKCSIMHADIKPDNILVNEHKTVLKVCDLGSASDVSENDITPYLVSRFYRAPEIILGVPYDCALDIWSIGCTLYELYTGKILFPGRSNNHMLLLMMELKGRFNSKMIKKAKFGDQYFDDMGAFESIEIDKVTGTNIVRKVHITKTVRDLRTRLLPTTSKASDEETKLVLSFIDLLDKCLMLDPSRRITPKEALVHPFIRG